MKLISFLDPSRRERLGVLTASNRVVDANLAYASYLKDEANEPMPYEMASARLPPDMLSYLQGGEKSLAALKEAIQHVERRGVAVGIRGERIVYDLAEVKLRAPVPRPGKIIHTAGNFKEHAEEGKKAGWEFSIPAWISYLKNPAAVIGPDEPIIHPKITKQLDHEIELAIVIGRQGKHLTPRAAQDHIAGYTVFNDITARDLQRSEMKHGLLNIGKNLDTFAPLGPCMVLRDAIGDVHNLDIELKVNGEVRQKSNTRKLSVTIPEIVSHYSIMTLEPGDIISTGTVSGVAAFRDNPDRYWLKPGDIVEARIENIGVLRNPVIAEE